MANGANWFDQTFYLEDKTARLNAQAAAPHGSSWTVSAVMAALSAAGLTPLAHYQTYGWAEGLAPNAFYDEAAYVASKVSALNAGGGAVPYGTSWTDSLFRVTWAHANPGDPNPFSHYLLYGGYEAGVDPSPGFGDEAYEAAKAAQLNASSHQGRTDWTAADVNLLFQAAGITPLGHYLAYGINENLNFTPTPEPTPGQTYVLTLDQDVINGGPGDDVVVGVVVSGVQAGQSSLQLFDSVDGGPGRNSLNLRLSGNNALSIANSPVLRNIQTINFTAVSAATADLTFIAPQATSVSHVSPLDALTLTGVGTAVNSLGMRDVTVDDADLTVTWDAGLTGSADALAFSVNGVVADVTCVCGNYSQVAFSGAAPGDGWDVLNLNASGAASRLETLTVQDDSASTLTTLNISGNASFRVFDPLDFAGNSGTVNASANSGGVNLVFGTQDVTALGGSGNDRFGFVAAGDLNAADRVDGGGGVNVLAVGDELIDSTTANLNAAIKAASNIGVLELFGNDADVDVSLFSFSKYVFATDGDVTARGVDGEALWFEDTAAIAAFVPKTGSTAALNLTLNSLSPCCGAGALLLDMGSHAAANVVSTGVAGSVNVIGLALNSSNSQILVSGSIDLQVMIANSGVINGSGFTGVLMAAGSADPDLVIGGANDDYLVGMEGDDVIQGGAGKDTIGGYEGRDDIDGGAGADLYEIDQTCDDAVATGLTPGAVVTWAQIQAQGTAYDIYSVTVGDFFDVICPCAASAAADKGTTAPILGAAGYLTANGAAYWNDGTNVYVVCDLDGDTAFDATDGLFVVRGVHSLHADFVLNDSWNFKVTD